MNNKFKYLILFLVTTISIYTISILTDFLISRIDLKTMESRNKIYWEMRVAQREEGFKLKNYEPILFPKMFANHIGEDEIFHIGGQPYKNVFYCNEGYGLVKYKSDRFGLRNNDANWHQVEKQNINKIMFVGDSFTHGACVHEEDTISNIIESYNSKNLISYNLGMAGNNSIMNALVIKMFTELIKPKYMIILIFPNDRHEYDSDTKVKLHINDKNFKKKYFIKKENQFYLSSLVINSIEKRKSILNKKIDSTFTRNKKSILSRAIPYLTLTHLMGKVIFLKEKLFFSLPDDTKNLIDIANNQCKIYKCTPLFTYVPSSKFWMNDNTQIKYKNEIEKYLNIKNNIFIDMSKIIDSNNKKYYAIKGGHLSPESYKNVAEEIYKKINK